MLKDYWGNDALAHGTKRAMEAQYADQVFVSVTNKPFGEVYVLYSCGADEREKADRFLAAYNAMMEQKGIIAFGAGVSLGENLLAERIGGFQGGVGL